MTYAELLESMDLGNYNEYTDRVDVTMEISLIEYGIMRNPKTNECLFFTNYEGHEPDVDDIIQLKSYDVSKDEVKEYLLDAKDGFFRFIGSNILDEVKRLDNDHLANIINSINQWDGHFNQ